MEIIMEDLITQQQAEQLLENTTPGPWKWDSHRIPTLYGTLPSFTGDYEFRVDVLEADHDGGCGCRQGCELEIHVSDADKTLLSSAPDLARAVIWLWEQNQQQQAKIKRLQTGVMETSRGEWAYATPDDMEDELESLIEGDMK